MKRFNSYKFDSKTFVIFDRIEQREICVCSNYDGWLDAEQRTNIIVQALNSLIMNHDKPTNHYIFLTTEGYTFQPGNESKLTDIENLQVIGFSKGENSDIAYKKLLSENPYLEETSFEKIFCYQLDNDYEGKRKDYNLQMPNDKQ
jgi:hypothetical protein